MMADLTDDEYLEEERRNDAVLNRPPDGVHLVRASEIEPEHVEYFDADKIPLRTTTLMVGLDGVGKSTVLYSKAAQATRGTLPGVFLGRPVDVVIASSEDHPGSVIVPRLIAAKADLERVHIVKVRRDGLTGDIALPDELDELEAQVQKVGARLLILDPLISYLPMNIDSHKAQHIRRVLAPLAHFAEEAHLAVVAVVHFNGGPSTDVRSRISGSKALRDASRSVLVCGTDPADESRFVMVQDKNSFGPRPTTGQAYRIETTRIEHHAGVFTTSSVVWLGDVEIDSRGLLAGPDNPEERSDIAEAEQILTDLIEEAGGRINATDAKRAATAVGVSDKTMQRARRRLGLEAVPEGFAPKVWWWCKPDISVLDLQPVTGGSTTGLSSTQSPSAATILCQSEPRSGHTLETVQYEPDKDSWYTPAPVIDAAREVLGRIDLDPASCAAANEVVGADRYFTVDVDGLTQPWAGNVFLNPPYSEPGKFTNRVLDEYEAGNVTASVVVTNDQTDAAWYHRLLDGAAAWCHVSGRLKFWHPGKYSKSPRQGQTIFYLGSDPPRFKTVFGAFGKCFVAPSAKSDHGAGSPCDIDGCEAAARPYLNGDFCDRHVNGFREAS
jgi:AAA domain/DNA N-6-adenine-methyltransferase (Dam)